MKRSALPDEKTYTEVLGNDNEKIKASFTELSELLIGDSKYAQSFLKRVKPENMEDIEIAWEELYEELLRARYSSFEELKLYCHRVAGVVGCLIARILGFSDDRTLEYADKMGLALQLTNIIRDVGEDARNGRIYLPMEEMQRFDVPASVIMQYYEIGRASCRERV